jgi:hypothetical protein
MERAMISYKVDLFLFCYHYLSNPLEPHESFVLLVGATEIVKYCERLSMVTSYGITACISASRQLLGSVFSSHLGLYLSLQSLCLGRCRGITRTFVSPTLQTSTKACYCCLRATQKTK